MVHEERKCPNCGSNEILEKNGTFVCMNCKTFFDMPTNTTTIHIYRNETEIEKMKIRKYIYDKEYEETVKKEHPWWFNALLFIGLAIFIISLFTIFIMIVLKAVNLS